jgi:hypothetical protein
MAQQHHHWHPTWYKPEHAQGWDRVKEAFHRDWEQTKHDMHLGGHELNQKVGDTVKQSSGKEAIPAPSQANPPKVIGDLSGEWERVEQPLEYGYSARMQYGKSYDRWNDDLEKDLRSEWESPANTSKTQAKWDEVKHFVRRGYDYKS